MRRLSHRWAPAQTATHKGDYWGCLPLWGTVFLFCFVLRFFFPPVYLILRLSVAGKGLLYLVFDRMKTIFDHERCTQVISKSPSNKFSSFLKVALSCVGN